VQVQSLDGFSNTPEQEMPIKKPIARQEKSNIIRGTDTSQKRSQRETTWELVNTNMATSTMPITAAVFLIFI